MADLSQLTDAQLAALANPGAPSQLQGALPTYRQPSLSAFSPDFDPTKATDAQLRAYVADTDPRMSALEDVGRSAQGGVVRGVAGVGTSSRGIADMAHGAAQAGVDFAARHLGVGTAPTLPPLDSLLHPPGTLGFGDALQIASKVGSRAANQVLPKWAQINPGLMQMAVDTASPTAALSQYGSSPEQTVVALNGGVPIHQPQTTAGRYAQRIAEFAPMLTTPGNAVQRIAAMFAPGTVSQAAEDMAPEKYKGLAGFGGAALGGGLVALGNGIARAPEAAFGKALGGVSDEQMAMAQALRQDAAARGLDITVPEAVQQVTDNGTGLGRLQRVIEGTRQGQALTAPYFAQRPEQVAQAVRDYADTIAPATDQPSMIGARAQGAATGVLDTARRTVNAIAGPDYAAIEGQAIPPEQYATLAANPSYKIALAHLRSDPELGATVAHLPDNNLAVVNEVEKRLQFLHDQAAGTPLSPGDNQLAGLRVGAKALADAIGRQTSERVGGGEYGSARDTVSQLSGQYVDPLKAGPLGAISKTPVVKTQASALYPGQPLEGAPGETAIAVRGLNSQAPGVADDLTRQHLVNALNESLSQLQGGQNQYAGAKFAVSVAANPEQAAALRAGIDALPEGSAKAEDLDRLLEALRATGKRQPPGSMTAFNEGDLKALQIAKPAQAIGRIADPLEWGKGLGDIINGISYRRNVSRLAQIIMADPEGTAAALASAQKAASHSTGGAYLPAVLRAGSGDRR